MPNQEVSVQAHRISFAATAYQFVYRVFAYFGLFSLFGGLVFGYRFAEGAPVGNFALNAVLYGLFIAPHLIMTRSWFKRAVWGHPAGSPRERRLFIFVAVVMWLAVLSLHWPVPGTMVAVPKWVPFAGIVFFLMSFRMFFEGVTIAVIDGLLGVPGTVSAYSHGPETLLLTDGSYARVRHPMYRSFTLAALSSLLIHPHTSQLFWVVLLCGTFVAFVPVEEAQLIRARGDDYRDYMKRTRWRMFRGIW
ncbi:MAG: methyltransferase family protein [Planctomycetota bacterium]|jgi:protein-S-isoprenylcysteine O-methyltransferase Ste14